MDRYDKLLDIIDFATDLTGAITDKVADKAFGSLVLASRVGKQAPNLLRLFGHAYRI